MRFKQFLTYLLFPLLLSSCNNITKFNLSAEYYEEGALVEVETGEAFNALRTDKASFILYMYNAGCQGCMSFTPVLETYVTATNITILTIQGSVAAATELVQNSSYVPTVFLYNTGKLATYLDPMKNAHYDAFQSSDAFGAWLTTYVYIPAQTDA